MVKLGQKVRFDPFYNLSGFGDVCGHFVEGTVILIHPTHEYFTVSYELGDKTQYMSFKFNDLTGERRCVWKVKK